MKRLEKRLLANTLFLLIACVLLFMADSLGQDRLYMTAFFSGWVLLGLLFGLSALQARKKLRMLPLGSVTGWLQLHIYGGLFSLVAFWVHARTLWPQGYMDISLALLFGLVALSGVIGLLLSRTLPRRLTRRGENLIFERIDGFRTQLWREVEELVLRAAREHGSSSIPDFYNRWLSPFFVKPRNFWAHIWESRAPVHRLAGEMSALDRYLNDAEREIMREVGLRVQTKHGLDYQYAAQSLLKRWLFVHIPLTYGLLGFALAHAVLAYAFRGLG